MERAMFPAEVEICQLVGKLIDYKLSIVKDNDINLSGRVKSAIKPWAIQLRDEVQELVKLIEKRHKLDYCWCDGERVCAEFETGNPCKELS